MLFTIIKIIKSFSFIALNIDVFTSFVGMFRLKLKEERTIYIYIRSSYSIIFYVLTVLILVPSSAVSSFSVLTSFSRSKATGSSTSAFSANFSISAPLTIYI